MPRAASQALVVIYCIAAPVLLLASLGWFILLVASGPVTGHSWLGLGGTSGLGLLLFWRLMLHRRALFDSKPLSKSDLDLFSDAPESEKTE